jgi:hypothetical protein
MNIVANFSHEGGPIFRKQLNAYIPNNYLLFRYSKWLLFNRGIPNFSLRKTLLFKIDPIRRLMENDGHLAAFKKYQKGVWSVYNVGSQRTA